ncbi:MAG: DNA translocase FtsK 4TM domain-containing protein, partial [Bacteroidales bacterium]
MAKKKIEKKVETPSASVSKIKLFFSSEITHFITGLFLFVFDILLIVSYLSFFFTGAADQSKIDNNSFYQLMSISNGIENWAGSIGAFLSDLFMNKSFGVSSVFIYYFIGALALRLMKAKQSNLYKHFAVSVAGLIWGSLFFGFFFVDNLNSQFLYLGGFHGYYMSQLLQANVGWIGGCLLIASSFLMVMILINADTIPFLRKLFSFSFFSKKEAPAPDALAADAVEETLSVAVAEDLEKDEDVNPAIEPKLIDPEPKIIDNNDWISQGEDDDFVMPAPED